MHGRKKVTRWHFVQLRALREIGEKGGVLPERMRETLCPAFRKKKKKLFDRRVNITVIQTVKEAKHNSFSVVFNEKRSSS